MKICIFSDSHGDVKNMIKNIESLHPDMCFFLGDGERDIAVVEELYPQLPIYAVRGNCDFGSSNKDSICCEVDGVKIFATHGHLSSVKYETSLDTLTSQALDAGADIALFGHTHRQHLSYNRGVMLLNPGSSRYQNCAVLTIEKGFSSAKLL